ncbi:hypothetical protein F994_02945 [Acinetobacter bohemicus ANC 3994]|uniref:N-acetyltransferase domain-containing protein n=1 Tax=Acinetobacter bohemicus ANC 3994 TaxID=1217715 RepID=N8Q611_9GAMM|nr:N-acetyltransferase [Acinetobacter bohemicus]ENU18623.1 hypothetical protein F994_02945 [Acinetobacter bohemicus ANC 3994]
MAGYAIVFPGIKECIEDENRIYEVINDHGTIFAIVIDNKYRGNKLFKLLIDTIKEKYSEIQAECFPKLVPLYEREGFVAITSNDAQVVMQYAEVLPLVDSYKVNSGNHDQAFSRVDGIYKDIICQYGETRVAEANIDIDAATKLVAEIARKIFN